MASFPFPAAEPNPRRIFLIHIHGRCVERSSLIFDAWGYNVAINDDPYYHRFLYNLFSNRCVLSIGTSWLDIPLRNQAALVFRTQSYQRPSHISIDYYERNRDFIKNIKSNSVRRKWSNSMHAAYGVRMLVATKEKQVAILKSVDHSDTDLEMSPKFNDLVEVAEFFDECGDYESPLQQQWLLNASHSRSISPAVRIQATVIKLYKTLIDNVRKDSSFWATAARLEQHLRHFHYLYVAPYIPMNKCHYELWDELAQKITKRTWSHIDENLRFQFLIGQYELKRPLPDKIKAFTVDSLVYKERLSFGRMAWEKSDRDTLNKSALRLLDIGWESISSKLFLDAATALARDVHEKYDPQGSQAILELTFRGGDIARSTGYFRREVKAEVLAAMWLPDPQESRIRILSKIRAAELHHAANRKTSINTIAVIEPAMIAGLTAGLLASHIRSLALHYRDESELEDKVKASVAPLLEEAGIRRQDVPQTLLPYWEKLIERSLQHSFYKAINGDFIRWG